MRVYSAISLSHSSVCKTATVHRAAGSRVLALSASATDDDDDDQWLKCPGTQGSGVPARPAEDVSV